MHRYGIVYVSSIIGCQLAFHIGRAVGTTTGSIKDYILNNYPCMENLHSKLHLLTDKCPCKPQSINQHTNKKHKQKKNKNINKI